MHYEPNPFSSQALYYNAEGDYYVCPMGQRMERIGTATAKTESGYTTESVRYKAQRCEGCPLRGSCHKAKGDRIMEVNHRLAEYRRKARERLTSEEGHQEGRQRNPAPNPLVLHRDSGRNHVRHPLGQDRERIKSFRSSLQDCRLQCRGLNLQLRRLNGRGFFA